MLEWIVRKAIDIVRKLLKRKEDDPVTAHVPGVDEEANIEEKRDQRAAENSLTIPRLKAQKEKEEREATEGKTIKIPGGEIRLPPKKKKDKNK